MKVKTRNAIIILGLVLAVVLLVDFNRRLSELDRLATQLKAVRAEGTAVMQTQEALLTQVAFATSDESVEQWAYDNKWTRPGENPVELVPEGGATSTPQASPVSAAHEMPNWRIWWELFFGEDH